MHCRERDRASGPLPRGWRQAHPLAPKLPTIVLDLLRHVVIDHMLDGREVEALGGYVCGHENILLALPECLNGLGPLLLVWEGSGSC